ncbi:MAG: tetratricopeptide repeat protein [Acidobacteria bacterium]|nr:tetratricopeptide repeat protein [Acidobacteriota bacterium]MCZ6727638.1 tetratricopeptide repeat protein [Acidobacteriota bacterium]
MRRQLPTLTLALGFLLAGTAVQAGWQEGVTALKAKNYEQAAKEFATVVEKQPDWAPGQRMLGQVLVKLRRTDEALTHLRKAYDLEPSDPATQFALGQAYIVGRRYADGASILGKIDRSKLPVAQRGTIDQLLAVALSKSGQSGQALTALARAASTSPNDAKVQYQYGVAALNSGDLTTAIQALGKSVSIKPDAKNRKALVQTLMQQGRRAKGPTKTTAYRRASTTANALVSSEASFDNLMMLAGAALGAKDFDTVLSAADRAGRIDSSDWLPAYYMGQAYTKKAQYSSAETVLRKALNNASQSADRTTIWGQLGFVFEKRKAFDDAIAAYRKAGDSRAADRVQKNKETQQFNRDVEAQNKEIEALRAEQEELKNQLKNLPGATDPPLLF